MDPLRWPTNLNMKRPNRFLRSLTALLPHVLIVFFLLGTRLEAVGQHFRHVNTVNHNEIIRALLNRAIVSSSSCVEEVLE